MLPLPYTRQLSQWGSGPGSVTPDWAEWLPFLVLWSRGSSYFPVNQLIELQYSVLLAAAPALPSPFQGLTHSSARSRGHPIVAVVQYDWTTVCCFGKSLEYFSRSAVQCSMYVVHTVYIIDIQHVYGAFGRVESDDVAVLDQCQRPAVSGFWADVDRGRDFT